MIRYGLLGGRRPMAPWELYITVGAACLLAGILFAVLFGSWSSLFALGLVEETGFGVAGVALLIAGLHRRRRSLRRS